MRSLSKKGQLNTMGPAIIALVIAGVFLILGLIMLQELRDADIVSQVNSGTGSNDTLTTVTETGEPLAVADSPACDASITTVTNETSGDIINSGNYTASECTVSYTGADPTYNNTDWNVTYTYNYADEAYSSGNQTIIGLGTFADFWEIIVLAIVIGIVIGLLLVVFGGRRAR